MENKNCCNHDHHGVNVCVHMDGCCTENVIGGEVKSCTCVPVLNIPIGEGGQFATLTEALEYAGSIVHNTLFLEMVSNVTETRTNGIWLNGFGEGSTEFPGVKGNVGTVIKIAEGTHVYLYHDITVSGSTKTCGFNVYYGGNLCFPIGGCVLQNLDCGIRAFRMGMVSVQGALTFKNVAQNYSPAPNTVGNNNAYIYVE